LDRKLVLPHWKQNDLRRLISPANTPDIQDFFNMENLQKRSFEENRSQLNQLLASKTGLESEDETYLPEFQTRLVRSFSEAYIEARINAAIPRLKIKSNLGKSIYEEVTTKPEYRNDTVT